MNEQNNDHTSVRPGVPSRCRVPARRERGFTLFEMLVVIAIMGILMAMAAPMLKSSTNVVAVASRQLTEDLNQARLRAINGHTTVYVVFFPRAGEVYNPNTGLFLTNDPSSQTLFTGANTPLGNNLLNGQLISYAMFTTHSMGDQLGRGRPRYVVSWKTLPDGAFIEPYSMTDTNVFLNVPANAASGTLGIPCPQSTNAGFNLPYIAYDSQGRLVGRQSDVKIPLLRGTVSSFKSAGGIPQAVNASVIERPVVPAVPLLEGVTYYVISTTGVTSSVRYNGVVYQDGDTFVGVRGQAGYTVTGGVPQVKTFEGVSVNWLTGRAKPLMPQLP